MAIPKRWWSSMDDRHGLSTAAHTKFGENAMQVVFDSTDGQSKTFCDLVIGQPFGYEIKDLVLAVS
nr:hypothetical protein [Arthrobacter sp. B0490]